MQAIEFKATSYQNTISIPNIIPDGATFRVRLLLDEVTEKIAALNTEQFFQEKATLANEKYIEP